MPKTLEQPFLENSAIDGWPSTVDMKVILPGLVHYEDLKNSTGDSVGGNVLVQKMALDRMANSMEGKPIINWDHRKVSPEDFKKGRAQGVIIGPAIFNSADGWYHAKGLVWDESTRKNIENGFSISCAYTVSEWGGGPGQHNQVPYEREVLNGMYTHIAVVPVPRYEGARIELLNSLGGKAMGLMNLFRKDKTEEKLEIDLENTTTKVGDKDVSVAELVNSFRKHQAITGGLKDEDLIEVDGKKVSVLELKNAHLSMYNEAEKKDLEEKHNSGSHSTRLKNCAMCNAAEEKEKKEKEDEERKNSAAASAAKAKEDEERKNAAKTAEQKAKDEAVARAAELENARSKGGEVKMPTMKSVHDLMADGESRYGAKQPATASAK